MGDALIDFSNFGSLKSTEMCALRADDEGHLYFSNFGSLKSTEIRIEARGERAQSEFQQFRLVEEH